MRTHTLHSEISEALVQAGQTACSASLSSPIGSPGALPQLGRDRACTPARTPRQLPCNVSTFLGGVKKHEECWVRGSITWGQGHSEGHADRWD